MRTIKEFFLNLWWSLSLSLPLRMNFNDVEKHGNNDERGESSSISSFVSEICIDTKTEAENFSMIGCSHSYCTDCVVKYVGSKLGDNVINIRCLVPRCGGFLELDDCREILPKILFDRWNKLLCEAAVVENESERIIYCPFKDCSALIIVDDDSPTELECPNCKKQICVTCGEVWHHGIPCEENEDRVVMELAAKNRWQRCPNCRFFVEKRRLGCNKILCRCGQLFCYRCGRSWGSPSICECYLLHNPTTRAILAF